MHDIVVADDFDLNYVIDIGVDTVLANVAAHSSPGMRIPMSQWYELSSEACELWQSLSEADWAIILGLSPKSSQSPLTQPPKPSSGSQRPPGWSANNQQLSSYLLEIAIKDEDTISVPPDVDNPPDPSPAEPDTVLLANVTKQKRTWTQPCGSDLPPSDIRKVLSNDNTHKDMKLDTAGSRMEGNCG